MEPYLFTSSPVTKMNNVRIAIQSKGRLSEPSIKFLRDKGLIFSPNGRSCISNCSNLNIDILFLRDDDISKYVERGVADFGIVGENVLLEKRARVDVLKKLGFGQCKLVIAIPEKSYCNEPADLEGKRIATAYPDLLKQFLRIQEIKAEIICIKGSAEIAPSLNLADAVCDLVQTGKTLKENQLKPLVTIMESQAVLIQTPYPKRNLKPFDELVTTSL